MDRVWMDHLGMVLYNNGSYFFAMSETGVRSIGS